jgi:prokaryotic ubiquitin-like protein Pup
VTTQDRVQKRAEEPPSENGGARASIAERSKTLKAEIDSLTDAIDDILEENAEEFVQQYVQRGGE